MKHWTNIISAILLFCLFLLAGCHSSQNQPEILLDNETNTLTVDGVRYLRDEKIVAASPGNWEYSIRQMEAVGRVKEKGDQSPYLLYGNTAEPGQAFLYGRYDQFRFGPLTYDVWFRENMLKELTAPLTTEMVLCENLSQEQLFRLLALYGSAELDGSLSKEDARAEIDGFGMESFRLWRSVSLPHKENQMLSHSFRFYFSARTGVPYLNCQDGRLRQCPQELTDAMELVPSLPKIIVVAEGDPRISNMLNEVWQEETTLTLKTLKTECDEEQLLWDLEFRIDIYSDPEGDSLPRYILKGYYHPRTGNPLLFYRYKDEMLREVSKETADSLGL